jgi:hypothetical protein
MLDLQSTISGNSSKTLAHTIRPYQVLYTLKWENLLNRKQRDGWMQYFLQSYLTTRAAEALLNFAAEQATLRNEDLVPFINWAKIHAQEEKDHHKWYLDDLLAIGFCQPEVENIIADDIVLELLGVQFALIATAHPVSILGYVFVLEGYISKPQAIYELAQRFSIPDEGLRTIIHHAEIDQEHRKPISELIDLYSWNEFLYGTMLKAAITTLSGWTKLFTKLAQANT